MQEDWGKEIKIKDTIENNGLPIDITLKELFNDHAEITNFVVREIDTYRNVSTTFD